MNLAPSDPLAIRLTAAVHSGELDDLRALLEEKPGLANARIMGRKAGSWRTPLHVVTDWPGYFPNGPQIARILLAAGADPNAREPGTPSEAPLHWAASIGAAVTAVALVVNGAFLNASFVPALLLFILWTLAASVYLVRRSTHELTHLSAEATPAV